MNLTRWTTPSPYNKRSFLNSGGSFNDLTASYGERKSQPHDRPNSESYSLLSKETGNYCNKGTFNGQRRDSSPGMHGFMQGRDHVTVKEENYGALPPFNTLLELEPPSGAFGVLPHQAVKPSYDRREAFIAPISKTSTPFSNEPYSPRDMYSAPTSVNSAYGDNASCSPIVNSNFSSPSDYYSSPKQPYGAYNGQSPVPQSPSMAQISYPSSPFPNVDHSNCIPSVPPCSPANTSSYVNGVNGVPNRTAQFSSANSVAKNNYFKSSGRLHTPDYTPDCVIFSPEHKSLYSDSHSTAQSSSKAISSFSSQLNKDKHYLNSNHSLSSPPYIHKSAANSLNYDDCSTVSPEQLLSGQKHNSAVNSGFHSNQPFNSTNASKGMHSMSRFMDSDNVESVVGDKRPLVIHNPSVGIPDQDISTVDGSQVPQRLLRSSTQSKESKLNVSTDSANMVSILPDVYNYTDHIVSSCFENSEVPARRRGRKEHRRRRLYSSQNCNIPKHISDSQLAQECFRLVNDIVHNKFAEDSSLVPMYDGNASGKRLLAAKKLSTGGYVCTKCFQPIHYPRDSQYISNHRIQYALQQVLDILGNMEACKELRQGVKQTKFQVDYLQHCCTVKEKIDMKSQEELIQSHKSHLNQEQCQDDHQKTKLKLVLKLDPLKKDWYCIGHPENPIVLTQDTNSEEELPLKLLSSHEIKKENESDFEIDIEPDKNLRTASACEYDSMLTENPLDLNPEPLSVGNPNICQIHIKKEIKEELIDYYEKPEKALAMKTPRKKRSRKIKAEEYSKVEPVSPQAYVPITRRLRQRKTAPFIEQAKPEPVEPYFEDDVVDDSDDDPSWENGKKSAKSEEEFLAKPKRNTGGKRKRRSRLSTPRKRKQPAKESLSPKPIKSRATRRSSASSSKDKNGKHSDQFLIAKSDIRKTTPALWKIDRTSSMLQRFEVSEQNGVLLYRSTYTFAAGHNVTVNNYVPANVQVKSSSVVQYLGPNFEDDAAVSLCRMNPAFESAVADSPSVEDFDVYKEDFTVYIQSLLSQDMDPSFLEEIDKFKDDYFLEPIQRIEKLNKNEKEKLLLKCYANRDIQICANNLSILEVTPKKIEGEMCEVCAVNKIAKYLQFSGDFYDRKTLQPLDIKVESKRDFTVCDKCSTVISMHSKLHHTKYRLFKECHSKANEVREIFKDVDSPEEILKICLEDGKWIEQLFEQQVQMWMQSRRLS